MFTVLALKPVSPVPPAGLSPFLPGQKGQKTRDYLQHDFLCRNSDNPPNPLMIAI